MGCLVVKNHFDYELMLDRNFQLIFYIDGRTYFFPTLLNKYLIEIDVPIEETNINMFLEKKKSKLENKDVYKFLELTNTNITPFIWELMRQSNIDVFIQDENLFLRRDDYYIVLNNRNMEMDLINKLAKNYSNGISNSIKEEMYVYLRRKIINGVGPNEFANVQIAGFKQTQDDFEQEFLKPYDEFDFLTPLFLYERLLRLKEKYLNENHYLIAERDLNEIYHVLQLIKQCIQDNTDTKYKIQKQ